jgi:hypothetical protein
VRMQCVALAAARSSVRHQRQQQPQRCTPACRQRPRTARPWRQGTPLWLDLHQPEHRRAAAVAVRRRMERPIVRSRRAKRTERSTSRRRSQSWAQLLRESTYTRQSRADRRTAAYLPVAAAVDVAGAGAAAGVVDEGEDGGESAVEERVTSARVGGSVCRDDVKQTPPRSSRRSDRVHWRTHERIRSHRGDGVTADSCYAPS